MARLVGTQLDRPQFIWSPYTEFSSPLNQRTFGVLLSTDTFAGITNEARAGWSLDDLSSTARSRRSPSSVRLMGRPCRAVRCLTVPQPRTALAVSG